ncbi:MAG: type II toxin-antitoxin system VapC family toxin [Rhizobiaceae bacterium]
MAFVLDANILMNAAFIQNGSASDFIFAARKLGHTLLIDEATWAEAKSVLRRMARQLALGYDPCEVLDSYWRDGKAIWIPPAATVAPIQSVNRSDRPIVSAARLQKATLVTDDHPLIAQARAAGIPAETSTSAFLSLGENAELSPRTSLPPLPPKRAVRVIDGHVIARVHMSAAVNAATGKLTVVDRIGRVWLYYDCASENWCADIDGFEAVNTGLRPSTSGITTIAFSYRVDIRPSKKSEFVLRVATEGGGQSENRFHSMRSGWRGRPIGDAKIGYARSNNHHLNGGIVSLAWGLGRVNREFWKAIVADHNLTPSFYDADKLREAMQLTERVGGTLVPPTVYELDRL